MKHIICNLSLSLLIVLITSAQVWSQSDHIGGWTTTIGENKAVCIIADGYFSIAYFQSDNHEFVGTEGGTWEESSSGMVSFVYEFNTADPEQIGLKQSASVSVSGDMLYIEGDGWSRLDDGGPGELAGAWLITGRERDGELQAMQRGPRKTMKILSGTRFQWIAYNVETKDFRGTGGGTYTTEGGKYTETIDFFSRDVSRVGAVLPFNYELKDGAWHHSGKSSKGDPIYEVWSQRPLE